MDNYGRPYSCSPLPEEESGVEEAHEYIEPERRYLINDSSTATRISPYQSNGKYLSDEKEIPGIQDGGRDECNGTYRDYEEVLRLVGFGKAQLLLLLGVGLVNASDAVEVLGISFILQYLRLESEFGIFSWQVALLSAIMFIGMLIGGYIWGGLADISGRRTVFILCLFFNSFFAFVSAFSPNYYYLLGLRFLSGFGVGGTLPLFSPYLSEFVGSKYRGPYLNFNSTSWIIGAVLCSGLAWGFLPHQDIGLSIAGMSIHSWRVFLFLCALPSFISGIFFIFMPEGPRYLLEVKKEKRALRILRIMYNLNHPKRNYFPVRSIKLHFSVQSDSNPSIKYVLCNFRKNFIEILKRTSRLYHRSLVRPTVLLMIIYFCFSFGAYGVTLWFPSYVDQLAKRNDGGLANETTTDYNKEYLHDLIITSSAFIGNLISAIAVYYFIRSFLLALFLFVGFLSIFLLYIIHTEAGVVVMLSVFKAIAAPGWSITSVLVADIFPTSLRSTALGVFLLTAKIGAIMGTYIFGLFTSTSHVTIPVLLTAAILLSSAVLSLFLPRTTRKTALK